MKREILRAAAWLLVTGSPELANADEEEPPPSRVTDKDEAGPSSASAAAANVRTVRWHLETLLASTYVSRAVPQYPNRRVSSSQSTATMTASGILGAGDVSLTVWNATALTSPTHGPTSSLEIDTTGAYSLKLSKQLEAQAGYVGYFYPRSATVDGAHEVFASLSWVTPVLTPMLSAYGEVARQHGAFVTFALSHTATFGPLSFTGLASMSAAGYEAMRTHLNDVTAGLSGDWSFLPDTYVGVRANASYLLRPDDLMPVEEETASRLVPTASLALGMKR